MKTTSIVVAAVFSALTLPVFAQSASPATATVNAATKAPHAAKHKAVKHAKKAEGKTANAKSASPASSMTPAK